MINFINKKNFLRNMSDEDFERALPSLSAELAKTDYHYHYDSDELLQDWQKLVNYHNDTFSTASQVRYGMKLCEHYFPNFFAIKNANGKSFEQFWNANDLQKVIRWNRKSHSTPYLSEFRRGIIFCYGLTKNTMYRPHLAKMICEHYKAKVVFDPCCGWGGRMLGTVAAGAHYIGCEPNKETYDNLLKLAHFLNIEKNITIYNCGAETLTYDFDYDLMLTSPPYFNLEIYDDAPTQSENQYKTYDEWYCKWLEPIIYNTIEKAKVVCWNTANVGKMMLQDDIQRSLAAKGWQIDKEFQVTSSARQTNQNKEKNKKNSDLTICYTQKALDISE